MKNYLSFFLILLYAIITGCNKDPEIPLYLTNKLNPITLDATTTQTTANTAGRVEGDNTQINDIGICYAVTANPSVANKFVSTGKNIGDFMATLNNLSPNTLYFYRTYIITPYDTLYGNQKQFNTLSYQLATLSTLNATVITKNSANSGGTVILAGGGRVSSRGVCWSVTSSPTINNAHTLNGSGTGSFTSAITGLTANTQYYARSYAINEAGISYGPQISFVTLRI